MGEQISEARLSAELNVSKSPIREALYRLQVEGLVRVYPRRGTFVFSPTHEELDQIFAFRSCVESGALEIAYGNAPAELIERLSAILSEMGAALNEDDLVAYHNLDSTFHAAIMDCSGNEFLKRSYELVAGKVIAMRLRFSAKPEHVRLSFTQHETIVWHLKHGDLALAVAVLRRHVEWREGQNVFWKLDAPAEMPRRVRET
ncbi:GntR family transcriptional regulator [Microvirga sp. M2]|uniref:GntR family transcriptional regulator n=1 Tax=Microvirga sp. M2 TaxID=3073270 RepID=UPI0039C1E08C